MSTRLLIPALLGLTWVAGAQSPTPFVSIAPTPPEQHEPTLKEFPVELARNFRALISTDNILPFFIGGAASAAAMGPKGRVEGFFQGKQKYGFHEAGDLLGDARFAIPAVGSLLLMSRTSEDARFRSFSYAVAQGFIVNQSIVGGMKTLIRSERPNGANFNSFPSGHTSGAFTWATIVSHYYGKKAAIPAYLTAAFVGYSRMDDGAHRLTDVVAGAAIGYIVGRTVSRRYNPDRRYDWNVMIPPGGGVGLAFQYRLP